MIGALEQRLVLRGRTTYRLSAQIVAHAPVRLADGEPPAGVIPPAAHSTQTRFWQRCGRGV